MARINLVLEAVLVCIIPNVISEARRLMQPNVRASIGFTRNEGYAVRQSRRIRITIDAIIRCILRRDGVTTWHQDLHTIGTGHQSTEQILPIDIGNRRLQHVG